MGLQNKTWRFSGSNGEDELGQPPGVRTAWSPTALPVPKGEDSESDFTRPQTLSGRVAPEQVIQRLVVLYVRVARQVHGPVLLLSLVAVTGMRMPVGAVRGCTGRGVGGGVATTSCCRRVVAGRRVVSCAETVAPVLLAAGGGLLLLRLLLVHVPAVALLLLLLSMLLLPLLLLL